MGCLHSKEKKKPASQSSAAAPTTYSWDSRRATQALDPNEYRSINVDNQRIVKDANTIKGQQYVVENARGCSIFLLDWCDSVTVDEAENCFIMAGPISGSIFLRNCKRCVVVVACQQFRIRDCSNMTFMLHCSTKPIIESSKHLKFCPWRVDSYSMREHIAEGRVEPLNNYWEDIHDFTKDSSGEAHYKLLGGRPALADMYQCWANIDAIQKHATSPALATPLPAVLQQEDKEEGKLGSGQDEQQDVNDEMTQLPVVDVLPDCFGIQRDIISAWPQLQDVVLVMLFAPDGAVQAARRRAGVLIGMANGTTPPPNKEEEAGLEVGEVTLDVSGVQGEKIKLDVTGGRPRAHIIDHKAAVLVRAREMPYNTEQLAAMRPPLTDYASTVKSGHPVIFLQFAVLDAKAYVAHAVHAAKLKLTLDSHILTGTATDRDSVDHSCRLVFEQFCPLT